MSYRRSELNLSCSSSALQLAGHGAREHERQEIIAALGQTGGRKADAAQLLGISRATLWRKMREHRF